MSDNNGERRSFRSGGSTPWSGRSEGSDRKPEDRRPEGRSEHGRSQDDHRRGENRPDRSGDRPDRGGDRRQGRPADRGTGGRSFGGGGEGRTFDRGSDRQQNRSDAPSGRGAGRGDRERPQGSDRPRTDRDRQGADRDRQGGDRGRVERPRSGDRTDRPGRPTGDRPREDRRSSDPRGGTGHGPDRRSGGAPHRRGGEGGFGPGRGRDSGSSPRRDARPDEPDLPDDVEASELDPTIRRDLLSLDKLNANSVARHLVMAGKLIDDDPRAALAHARAARQRAGRIAVVREAAGITAYHAGEWAEALSELRAARRMSGGPGLLAVMADCERGLGRSEKAIELGRSEEARALTGDEASELRIVVAGARMDLGQFDQAVVTLQTPDLDPERTGTAAARLFYAYADALVACGRTDEGVQWFLHAASADIEGVTDAEERVEELTGEGL
ncbi:hypothetical protein [Rhodococcus chondri]|uniref:TPR-repeat-containing protein n=1 Tax=Rhodococcus chondri TaxID=3065941 RepID=A0ABU7JXQ3_9NOCA|nr:hypothetical protein [Rhodococcus sp. CC-R104]MEE2034567.1 hypothetical protein [Rhodococcus sp. CC-R104]